MKNRKRNEPPAALMSAEGVGLTQKTSVPGVIFGMLCRYAVALCGTFGVCLMLENSFSFIGGDRPGAALFIICAAATAALFLLFIAANTNKAFFISTLAVFALAAVYIILFRMGVKRFFVYVPVTVWNHVILKLVEYGYTSLSWLTAMMTRCDPSSADGIRNVLTALIQFSFLSAFAFTSCTFRKARAVPAIIMSGVVMTVTFTYNILTDNFGFLFVLAAGAGILILKYYSAFSSQKSADNEEKGMKSAARRRGLASSAKAGFAAFTAAAIVLAAGAYPAAHITGPAPEMKFFNGMMEAAREYVYRIITPNTGGSGATMIDPDAQTQSAEPTTRTFTGKTVMTVTAPSSVPVYLRSWVGDVYTRDSWSRNVTMYPFSDGFVPEDVTELFYLIVDNDANVITAPALAEIGSEKRGFIKELVTVKSNTLKSRKGYLPSRYSHYYGVTEPGSLTKQYPGCRFDTGIGTVELPMDGAEYSSAAYVQTYKNVSLSKLDRDMKVYELIYPRLKEYIEAVVAAGLSSLDAGWSSVRAELELKAEENGLTLQPGCIIYRLNDMSMSEIRDLYTKMNNAEMYERYVYENCTGIPWSDSELLSQTAYRIMDSADVTYPSLPSDIYRLSDGTARYLEQLCEYSVDPQGYDARGGSYISQFLTTAKNGYCVQYATAAALIIRAAGVPTRFCEGFVASEFSKSGDTYVCRVKDGNAHAWTEVYVGGYGWMTFEMTGPMMDNMYPSNAPSVDTSETDPPVTRPPVTEPPETTTDTMTPGSDTQPFETTGTETMPGPHGFGGNRGALIAVLICVTVVFALSTALYLYLKAVDRRKKKMNNVIMRAEAGESPDPKKDTGRIAEYIRFLFGIVGVRRAENELMSEFTQRVNEKTEHKADFTAAADAIQKYVFGHESNAKDCAAVASYASFLSSYVRGELNGIRRFYYVHLRKLL